MAWSDTLRPASFRGVPFGVLEAEKSVGRRIAVHEYPFKDAPWAEDLGLGTRRHRVRGFLVEGARYGGGSVLEQRSRMEGAAEQRGQATLVHPTLGNVRVTLQDLVIAERWDGGRCFELQFTLIEGGEQTVATAIAGFSSLLGGAADLLGLAGASQFVTDTLGPLQSGLAEAENMASTGESWARQITSFGSNATNLFGSLSSFGRFL